MIVLVGIILRILMSIIPPLYGNKPPLYEFTVQPWLNEERICIKRKHKQICLCALSNNN